MEGARSLITTLITGDERCKRKAKERGRKR